MVSRLKLEMLAKKARGMIRDHGWMIQAVFPDPDHDENGFSYTVGLSSGLKHPEVFLVGFHPELSHQLLNVVGRHVKKGMRFDRPVFCNVVVEGYPVAFRPAEDRSVYEHSGSGRHFLRSSFSGMQMFLPDPKGLFPWDEGCDPAYVRMQTLLELVGEPPIPGSGPTGLH